MNGIKCGSLPSVIDTDIKFDSNLDLSNCTNTNVGSTTTIFAVRKNPTIDCDGKEFIGFGGSVAFQVFGGATFKNCKLSQHEKGIVRYEGGEGSGENSLVIQDSTIAVQLDPVDVSYDPQLRERDENVAILMENSHITGSKNGIKMTAHGQIQVNNTIMTASSLSRGCGILVDNSYHTVSIDVQHSKFSGYYSSLDKNTH